MSYFLVGATLGFLFWTLFAGKHEGDKIEKSIRPMIGEYRIHIHHWIWSLALLLILREWGGQHYVWMGFLGGSTAQGLSYRDRFVILYKDSDFEKIYSRWKKLPDFLASN